MFNIFLNPNWVVVVVLILYSTVARAQDIPGKVHGVLFEDAKKTPIQNVSIFSKARPDSVVEINDGVFELTLPPGRHELLVHLGNSVVARLGEVDVVAGYSVEVVGSINATGDVTSIQVEGISKIEVPKQDAAAMENAQMSALEGRVIHAETGEGIEGARVFVRGQSGEAVTDASGHFHFNVPVGVHDVSVLHHQYATVTKKNVSVVADAPTILEIKATPLGVMLQDYVVTAPRIEGGTASLMEERKESTAVEDVIGAEQMSKTGDSNAASALKRVTGITVVGGKYVYVRGLGERYSSTLFNGAMLPSPEPERRVIPLDMFPSGMLESVVVQKTYSPELPGEFGGGVVMLRSRNYPSTLVFDISGSGELLTGTTFSKGWKTKSGPTDWLGIDGGYRSLPGEFVAATKDKALAVADLVNPDGGFTPEELEHLGEIIPKNWHNWKGTVPPNWGLSLSVGNTFKLKRVKLGVLGSAMYDNEWENVSPKMVVYNMSEDSLRAFHEYDFETNTNTVKTAAFLAVGLEFSEHHSLRSTTMLNRISDKMTRWYQGRNDDANTTIRVFRSRWVERQLFSQQLLGEHVFERLHDLGVTYRYTFSRASRLEPLRLTARQDYEDSTGNWRLSDRPEGNSILYSELFDITHDLGMEVSLPFEFNARNNLKLFAGGALMIRDREVDTRRFKYDSKRSNTFPGSGGPLTLNDFGQLFVDEYIGPFTYEGEMYNGFQLLEATMNTDNYSASQNLSAGYGKAELQLVDTVKVMGGARVEKSDQNVKTFELFNPAGEEVNAGLETLDVLPAATVSWEFKDGMIIRGGYGRTVSRPEFREMSPALFNDVTGGNPIVGNEDLKRAVIDNFDVRWDWFFAPGEMISLGGFFKQFDQPIEVTIRSAAQLQVSWQNARSARNFGLEFDLKKNFDWISESLKDIYFAANASVIRSQVKLDPDGIQTNNNRPLQGQSPFVLNCQLGYDNVDNGRSLIMLYNVFGKRISEVGALGLPDTVELPFHSLSFVAKMKVKEKFKFSFKIGNILNQTVAFTQGGKIRWKYKKGISFSVGAGFSY
ncbi:MAG: TonB-dependent receptor [Deltaproteobacteria bacterium]|nr:TonB-dependent receptor [Deltaproteobacteria bacterium]